MSINKATRARALNQQPRILWLTGLPCAGKSTIAGLLEKKLEALGQHTYLMDGDNIRLGLSRDLDFTPADRVEDIRRVSEVAKLMVVAGLVAIVAIIFPFRAERAKARRGELPHFTGIDSPYEPPENLELHINTVELSPDEAGDGIVQFLHEPGS